MAAVAAAALAAASPPLLADADLNTFLHGGSTARPLAATTTSGEAVLAAPFDAMVASRADATLGGAFDYPVTQRQYALIGGGYRKGAPSGDNAGDMKPAGGLDWGWIRSGTWPDDPPHSTAVDPVGAATGSQYATWPRNVRGGGFDSGYADCASYRRRMCNARSDWVPTRFGFRLMAPMGGQW